MTEPLDPKEAATTEGVQAFVEQFDPTKFDMRIVKRQMQNPPINPIPLDLLQKFERPPEKVIFAEENPDPRLWTNELED